MTHPISIRFDADERAWLERYARSSTRSISNAVRAIVRDRMAQQCGAENPFPINAPCVLQPGHDGPHSNGASEWFSVVEAPGPNVGEAVREMFRDDGPPPLDVPWSELPTDPGRRS